MLTDPNHLGVRSIPQHPRWLLSCQDHHSNRKISGTLPLVSGSTLPSYILLLILTEPGWSFMFHALELSYKFYSSPSKPCLTSYRTRCSYSKPLHYLKITGPKPTARLILLST